MSNNPSTSVPPNIPIVERITPPDPEQGATAPPPDEAYSGLYRNINDSELYALAVVSDPHLGRTHRLKNSQHYFECDEKDFRKLFERC